MGGYRLHGVGTGAYNVFFSGKLIGYETRPRGRLRVLGRGAIRRDFVLGRANLRGVVRDAETGQPLPEVSVGMRGGFWYAKTTTDAEGAYAFYDVVEGEYRLSLDREGYGYETLGTGPVPAEGVRTVDGALRPAAVLVLEVRDRNGRPVPGRHSLGLRPVGGTSSLATRIVVGADGLGRYRRVVPGTYELSLRADGFFRHAERVEIGPGENRLRVRLERADDNRRLSLQGTLRDAATGRPIAGVSVAIQGPGRFEALTDESGAYRLYDVPPGPCVVILSRDGYGIRYLRDVSVGAKARTQDFALDPAATLHLYVTDRASRPVVGRLSLGIRGRGDKTTRIGTGVDADAKGHAIYRRIVPGFYELRVRRAEVGEATVKVEIAPGENTVSVRLE